MGVNGVTIGAGEIIGGLLLNIIPSIASKFKRIQIVTFGAAIHIIAFVLIYGNFSPDAPLKTTLDSGAFFDTPIYSLSVVSAFLLGLGDACFNTQIYGILGTKYKEDSAPAFAIFKSFQSIFAAISFFYSGYLNLTIQLGIIFVLNLVSVFNFTLLSKRL